MLTVSNLIKAERDCAGHINNLLRDARFLYENNKFPNSIFLSIIAIEEIGKYATYCDYLRKSIPMPDGIEKRLRSDHNFKLQQLIALDHKRNQSQSNDPKQVYGCDVDISFLLKQQENLNKIKQLCLYYDFKCETSVNVACHFSHRLPKNHLAHFCFVISNFVFFSGSMEFLRQRYGNCDGILYLNKINSQDPLYIELLKVIKSLSSENGSIKRFQNVFHELTLLYDGIYRNNMMNKKRK